MKTIIIDYGSENLQPLLDFIASLKTDHEILISNRPEILRTATHLILSGASKFSDYMQDLKAIEGLGEALHKQIMIEKKPLLGICAGMQVLASSGHENQECKGLGFIDGKVVKIESSPDSEGGALKIPQAGFKELILREEQLLHPILKGVKNASSAYFDNSSHFLCQNEGNVVAQAEYGLKLNAIIAKKNIVGVQFVPEKSGEVGLQILKNFLNWRF